MELLERFLNKGIPVVIMAVNLADSLALAEDVYKRQAYPGEQHHPWNGVQDRHRPPVHPSGTERTTAADTHF